jgi:hypothetical protein
MAAKPNFCSSHWWSSKGRAGLRLAAREDPNSSDPGVTDFADNPFYVNFLAGQTSREVRNSSISITVRGE